MRNRARHGSHNSSSTAVNSPAARFGALLPAMGQARGDAPTNFCQVTNDSLLAWHGHPSDQCMRWSKTVNPTSPLRARVV
eukprot:8291702-Pyramimonas_sp.AAC.1